MNTKNPFKHTWNFLSANLFGGKAKYDYYKVLDMNDNMVEKSKEGTIIEDARRVVINNYIDNNYGTDTDYVNYNNGIFTRYVVQPLDENKRTWSNKE